MAHKALFITFCSLLPKALALHLTVNQDDFPRSFVSKNKLYCAQAKEGIATDALKLFKSMPRGKLFDGTMLNLQLSCSDMGYKQSSGEDPCYPGLHIFYHNKDEREQFMKGVQSQLREFGKSKDMTLEEVNFADTCKCHGGSVAKKSVGKTFNKSCDNSPSLLNGPPRSFVSKNKVYCAQAQKDIANDALNLFKSMPRAKMFGGTMLNLNKSCHDMGYKQSAGQDQCYPGLHVFYRSKEEGQQFMIALQDYLKAFGEHAHMTWDQIDFMDSCKCLEQSYTKSNVQNRFKKTCDESDAPRSFVSKNRLFCAQAKESIATDALKLFKSMPRGKLFDGTMLNLQLSCADMGYTHNAGMDPCYPGLHSFYHNKEEGKQFMKELQHNLNAFGESKNLTLDEVNFMDTCRCPEGSYARTNVAKMLKKSCDNVPKKSSVPPVTPKK